MKGRMANAPNPRVDHDRHILPFDGQNHDIRVIRGNSWFYAPSCKLKIHNRWTKHILFRGRNIISHHH